MDVDRKRKRATRARRIVVAALAVALATAAAAVAAKLPEGSEPVALDPEEFTSKVDNPFFPLRPGSRWVYRETDPEGTRQKIVVTVRRKTRLIANGVRARVVRDIVTEDGEKVEVTDDWYAQDSDGNVWYLGEATTEFVNGKPDSTAGSFEAGVDGAQAGVVMPAKPKRGMRYRQEYYEGEAEDRAKVVGTDGLASVPLGSFDDLVVTKDVSPLDEPRVYEKKSYARGIGLVRAVNLTHGDREVLVKFRRR